MRYKRHHWYDSIIVMAIVFIAAQFACSSGYPLNLTPSAFPTSAETQFTSPIGATPSMTFLATPSQSGLEQIDESLQQSMKGSLAFNAPSTMTIDETKTIQLLMSPAISPTDLAGQVTESGAVVTAMVNITPRMKAELHSADPEAFIIQALHDNAEQILTNMEPTEWRWNITAKKEGSQDLQLIVFRLVEYQGKEFWRLISYETTINVNVTIAKRLERINWEWLIGILLTGLMVPAIWRWVDRRQKSRAKMKAGSGSTAERKKAGLSLERKTTILFLASDPSDASRLRLGEEYREIQEKLRLSKEHDKFQLEIRLSVRPGDITQAVHDVEPQIIHFSGHGSHTGELYFEDKTGKAAPVMPMALETLFKLLAGQVKCVILNACYSEIQAKAIASHIDYVIGMKKAIGDQAAIAFSIGFYKALGAGRTIPEAYEFGKVESQLMNIPEQLTPVLHMHKHNKG
jgi:hypothetical protein